MPSLFAVFGSSYVYECTVRKLLYSHHGTVVWESWRDNTGIIQIHFPLTPLTYMKRSYMKQEVIIDIE